MKLRFWISILLSLALISHSSAQDDDEGEDGGDTGPSVTPVSPQKGAAPPKKVLEQPTKKKIELTGPDPCIARPCKKGEECILKEDNPNNYDCRCVKSCANLEFSDPICTSTNRTFNTECELYQMQCLCNKNEVGCADRSTVNNAYVLYYAACHETYCNKEYDYQDYPARLALWLQMVFFEKARMTQNDNVDDLDILFPMDRKDRDIVNAMHSLTPGENGTANATFVTWWFCNLDKDNNNFLEKTEVAMLIRAIIPSDQCIMTFLGQCDANSDGKQSFDEWHNCFEVQKSNRLASCTDLYKVSRAGY